MVTSIFMTITLQDVATILGFPIVDDEIPSLFDQPFVDLRCSFNRSTNGYPYFITTHPRKGRAPQLESPLILHQLCEQKDNSTNSGPLTFKRTIRSAAAQKSTILDPPSA
ncbi:hypothetical protein JHK82_053088 [Glycine max]|nr:hypothetical protein JHK86_052934 [Glycine max]KAG4927307.1 hypothetical protein JHK85_053793 [Glycine max]KAG5082924.1 hypothetical protein JHK84_052962 [Glycine max]KAG5085691.1 hypothetical protein JHK82_053088 [Glycine max]